jgi:2-oxoglutarate dehydrogenase E2 component (dihydrolipoamide succinyltransferase)
MDMETKIPVPTEISATNSSIGRWFKRVGEPVTIDDPLVEVESDNITVEVLAPATGVLSEIFLRDGQSVVGSTTLGSITEFGNDMNNRCGLTRPHDGITYSKAL